jgi:hypothetical protein
VKLVGAVVLITLTWAALALFAVEAYRSLP